jgi:predicted permease
MAWTIIVKQIGILAILVLIGMLACRARIITSESKDFLARIIYYVTLPALLLTNFSSIDLTPRLLSNSLQALLLSALVMLFMLFAGWLITVIAGIKGSRASIFRLHSMLGNVIYLGLPIILSQFGKEGLLYGSIFILVSNIMMWTVGVSVITTGNAFSPGRTIRGMVNINTVAIITGFLLFLLSVKLPPFIIKSVGSLGGTTTYLSMIYIGSVLYFADGRKMLRNRNVYMLSASRLLLVPFILILIFRGVDYLFPGLLKEEVISVLVMQAAMPCMVNVVIMVNILSADDGTATANVFVSTILSAVTLPLILVILNWVA